MINNLRTLGAALALTLLPTIASAQQRVATAANGKLVEPAAATAPATPTTTTPAPAGDKKAAVLPNQITVDREVFAYEGTGRRDPYKSLMTTSDIRPLLSDLRLTAIAFDPEGNNSVAILRETTTKLQYRVKLGQQLGRLRVSSIKPKAVVFTIEEFGFNRQETLHVSSDTTKARTP